MPSRIIHLYEGIATPCPESCLLQHSYNCVSVCSNELERLVQIKSAVSAIPIDKGSRLDQAFLLGHQRDYHHGNSTPPCLDLRLATKITIPAVKITGDSADVVASLENVAVAEDYYLSTLPDPATSTTMDGNDWTQLDDLFQVTLDHIDSSLCPVKSTVDAMEDPDLGEFLLDAADWL